MNFLRNTKTLTTKLIEFKNLYFNNKIMMLPASTHFGQANYSINNNYNNKLPIPTAQYEWCNIWPDYPQKSTLLNVFKAGKQHNQLNNMNFSPTFIFDSLVQSNKQHNYKEEKLRKMRAISVIASRVSMRYTKRKNRILLNHIHQCIKNTFSHMNDDSLEWLIGGTNGMEHGGFHTVKELRKFFDKNSDDISNSDLCTGIESILTAMGYRMINSPWSKEPIDPKFAKNATQEQKDMQRFIHYLRDRVNNNACEENYHLVRPINEVYINRIEDSNVGESNYIYSGSFVDHSFDDYGQVKRAKKVTPQSKFNFFSKSDRTLTWPAECVRHNIPIKANASGTAALTIAALDAILSYQMGDEYKLWSDDTLIELFGPLIIATFERADYHTIAETMCGIFHSLKERNVAGSSEIVSSCEAFLAGVEALVNGCDIEIRNDLKEFIQEALEQYGINQNEAVDEKHDALITNFNMTR